MVSPPRVRGCAARQRDPAAGARAAGWRPTTLLVTIRRYRCTGCGHVWRQDTSRVAEGLGVSWTTANDAVLAEGRRVLIQDPHRFDGVRVTGVDEHCWRDTAAAIRTSP